MATNEQPKTTRLSNDVTAPQPTSPGDAPADTFDAKERATSVRPDKAAAAAAGHHTVNAVVPGDPIEDAAPVSQGRTETYTVYDNDTNPVQVTRDLDTGETTVTEDGGGVEGQAAGTFSTFSFTPEDENTDQLDPAEHTVDAVLEYLNGLDQDDQEAYDAEVRRVYESEQSGKARTSLLEAIDQILQTEA